MTPSPARGTILITLGSVVIAWALVIAAAYTELFVNPVYDQGVYVGDEPAIKASTYLLFSAVTAVAIAALVSQRRAIRARIALGVNTRLPRAVHRFTTLTIIITVVIALIVGISVFLTSFEWANRNEDIGLRFLTTYLPIILYTALIVSVLLAAFVFRKDSLPKASPMSFTPEEDESSEGSDNSRMLGVAYSVPIVALAIALIFGLVVYDITQAPLERWIWVIIYVIVATGIVSGTIAGEIAIANEPRKSVTRMRVSRSARILNFVLSLVLGAVVLIQSFVTGAGAVGGLKITPQVWIDAYPVMVDTQEEMRGLVNGYDLEPGTEVTVTGDAFEGTLISGRVGPDRSFYGEEAIPGPLEPGEYTLTASATAYGGEPLERSITFTITDDGTYDMDAVKPQEFRDPEPTLIDPTWRWFGRDFAPATVMLLLGLTAIYLTLTERNRAREESKESSTA